MILNCFMCKEHFTDFKKLSCHLKYFHQLQPNYIYECGIPDCAQKFANFSSFSRHMRNKLKKCEGEEINAVLTDRNDSNEETNSISFLNNSTSENVNLSETNSLHSYNNISKSHIFVEKQSDNTLTNNATRKNKPLSEYSFKLSLLNYSNKNFPRKEAKIAQKNIQQNITHPIRDELNKILIELKNNTSENTENSLRKLISFCDKPFDGFDTEYKFLKKLKEINLYENPKIIHINNTISHTVINQLNTLDEVHTKAVVFPIKFNLKLFFEIPGIAEEFEQNILNLYESDNLKNFCNGKIWQNKIKQYNNKFVIPFFLYFDDFEVNMVLGSHSSSLLGVYLSFPTAPDYLKFKLRNIFIVALYKSCDVKSFGNEKCFFNIIQILNDLELNGIDVMSKNGKKTIYFSLGLIVGDNLALNNILGFSRSFSSKYFCRTCKIAISETKFSTENKNLRNVENYTQDANLNDFQNTGIREISIFNKINKYHVVQNFYADLLHDMFEGVLKYDLCHIILFYLKDKTFDLELFNIRKQNFCYGEVDKGNKSSRLEIKNLKKFNLKMSGSEMMTFAHYFPLMIGDLVDSNDGVWKFVINLLELLDLMLLSEYTSLDIENLKLHIDYHNTNYTKLFHDTLKPKHHFLNHYCTILEHSGPFKYLWTFGFESKHRQLKTYTKNITSRVNLPLSLGIKFGIAFAESIMNFEKSDIILSTSKYSALLSPFHSELVKHLCEEELLSLSCYLTFERCGTLYTKGFVIFDYTPDFKAFQIQEIYVLNGDTYFFCQKINVISYKTHFISYLVDPNLLDFSVIKAKSVKSPPTHIIQLNDKYYIKPKQMFNKY